MALVKQLVDQLEKKREGDGGGGESMAAEAGSNSPEMQFVRAAIALHDKYLDYVETCYQSNTLFHKVGRG